MSQDPYDQLLLQIRGAVAEYERTLSTERMRRGRPAKLHAGQPPPWVPFGYRTDPERPCHLAGLRWRNTRRRSCARCSQVPGAGSKRTFFRPKAP